MSPIVHTGVALLGWHKTAARKDLVSLFRFILVANLHKANLGEIVSFYNLKVLTLETFVSVVPVLFIYRRPFASYFKNKEFWKRQCK